MGKILKRGAVTIARWETGAQQPSFAALRDAIRSCGLELMVGMAARDTSYAPQVIEQLYRAPAQRVRRLSPAGSFDRVDLLTEIAGVGGPRVIVVGEVAGGFPDGYRQLRPNAQRSPAAGTSIHVDVASLQDVEHSKRTAGRPKDIAYLDREWRLRPPDDGSGAPA